jgi:stage V sporulation protein B
MILGRLNDIGYTQAQGNAIYGAYSTMAVSIYNLPATLISAISLPLVPILVSAIEKREQDREKSIISSSLKLTALVGFPAGLGISVFSKQILSLLFSEQADSIEYVAPLLSILGMSVFLSSMITTTNAILQSYKLVNKSIISMISGMGVKVVAAYILIGNENVNIYGAPISTLFSVILIVSMNLYFIIKRCGKNTHYSCDYRYRKGTGKLPGSHR